jgi:glycosyltransferase involved in cell wall biosynthesis
MKFILVLERLIDATAALGFLAAVSISVILRLVFGKKIRRPAEKKMIVLDMAYTLDQIRKRQLQESVTCRDLMGYFVHVWSVHPFATVVSPEGENNTYGKWEEMSLSERHTVIEGKAGRFSALKELPLLNFVLAQCSVYSCLSSLIATENISVIRAGDPYYLGLLGLLLAKVHGIPLVIRIPGNYDALYEETGKPTMPRLFRKRWIEKAIEKITLPKADLVAGANRDNLNYALANGAAKERSTIFRYGNLIHSAHFRAPAERPPADPILKELGISGRRFLITIARLDPQKYPDDILHVLTELKHKGFNLAGLIVGDGGMKEDLLKMADGLGLENDVIFVGSRPQEWIATVLPSASVAVSPHMGRGLAEAALAGIPIVAYDYNWQGELIISGETGELVKHRDWHAMTDSVIKFLSSPEYARSMGTNARACALEMMDPERLNWHEQNEYTKLFDRYFASRGKMQAIQR